MTLLLAATVMEKLKDVPPRVWWIVGGGVAAFIIFVVVIRKIMDGGNKFILGGIVALAVFIVGMQWVYERNEPAWATPAVDFLSRFLPSKPKQPGAPTPPGKTPATKPK